MLARQGLHEWAHEKNETAMKISCFFFALFCCCIWIGKALQSLFSKHTSLYPSSTTHNCEALTAFKDQGGSHINATARPSYECSQLVHYKAYNQKILAHDTVQFQEGEKLSYTTHSDLQTRIQSLSPLMVACTLSQTKAEHVNFKCTGSFFFFLV